MARAKQQIKMLTDERRFVIVHHDFLESTRLTALEKIVFIELKKYANEYNQCYPSFGKLAEVTKLSKRGVQNIVKSLLEKKVLKKEKRIRADGGKTSNLYTLYDFKEMWEDAEGKSTEEIISIFEEQQIIEMLQNKGYKIIKAKEPDASKPTKVSDTTSSKHNQIDNTNDKSITNICQERYTIEQIKQLYEYDVLTSEKSLYVDVVDAFISVLYDTLNTSKNVIRINQEDKPSMAVISKLMKLGYQEILYSIDKYQEVTERINNPRAYILTLLYNAKEQMTLDITNEVNHDLSHFD